MRRVGFAVLVLASVLLSVPALVRLVGDHGHRPWVFLAVVVPFTFVPLLVVLAALLALRHPRWAALPAVPLVWIVLWNVPLFVGSSPGSGAPLTVMTANLKFGAADPFHLVQLVKEHRVDVLAMEELTTTEVTNLRGAGLETELPYFTGTPDPKDGPDGTGIWSRYPLTPQPAWPMRYAAPGALVQAPSGQVLVRAVHLAPPVIDERGVYRRDYEELLRGVRALPTTSPTLVLGDFNATLDNSVLREAKGDRFSDAGEEAGAGLLRTWGQNPGSLKLLYLDHVLVDPRVGVRQVQVVDLPGSDHAGLIARLVVR